ncbi:unnamed protein product [Heterobilharzia americana]|nr:unnamed protein product [Heterobilharzia americana]
MDVHYKTYASRSSRDIRFNQLLRTKPLSTCSSSSPTAFSKSSISVSPRKRVNVVSFVPTGEGQELITRSPEKIVSENQDNTTSGATQIAVPSQSYTPHSVTEVVVTNSQTVSSAGYKEYSNRPANTSTADNSRNRPPGYTFSRSPIRCTNPKFDQSQQDVALAPASTPSSHVTTVHCISSYPQMNIISYRSQPVSCPAKPATHPKLQSIDKSQVTPAVTVSNSQLKTYNCTDIPKSSRDRIFLNACSVATSETMDSSIFSVSKSSSRPLLTGKNKRAAYNPRSWQKDIETEDSSPTKLQRMSEPFLCQFSTSPSDSQLDTKESSALTSQQNPETCMDYKKSGSNELDDFAFHDCEEEITKNCGTLRPTSCSSKTLTKCRRKSDEEDEDVEEDDVKPWFRPASRDKVSAASGEKLSGNSKKIKVSKSEKSLYTVLHKVKEAYVCQEQGETQDLLDDVEYLVDGLADRNQVNTRALSVLTLANKCLAASFRYTLIAHGLLKRICAKLHDAYKDYTLALTSAGLLFVLSRDRDPNILDVDSLAIVLKLFSAPDTNSNGTGSVFEANRNKEAERVRMRVRQLLDALQQNNAKSLTSTTSNTLDVSNNSNTITSSNQSLFSGGKRSLLPFGSKPPICASLNTRHLQMTRQLTMNTNLKGFLIRYYHILDVDTI